MQLRIAIPILLAFAAFGCGTNHTLTGPTGSSMRAAATMPLSAMNAANATGAVYTMSNAASGNAVLAYTRASNGTLGGAQSFATEGTGTGAGLGNQGALALDEGGRFLFVVNAGSNDISVFRTTSDGLVLVDRKPSGGERPISLTVRHGLLYVVNAGGSGVVQGFRVDASGALQAIAGAARSLSMSGAVPAQIGFAPDGDHLVVTEKSTNALSIYAVAQDGSLSGPTAHASSGATPFGFGFDNRGTLVVSEAFGGAVDGSAVSSYRVASDGSVTLASGSIPTHQTAACWIAVSRNNGYAYAANAGSASITTYAIAQQGALSRLGNATPTGAGPSELTFTTGGRFLYVLNGGAHSIGGYWVDGDGGLVTLSAASGLVGTANGLAAR